MGGAGLNDATAERDFYRRLLELGTAPDPEPLLERALELIVLASGARAAYIELLADDPAAAPYWRAHGCSDEKVASIQRSISRGIIARALASGETVATPAAVADPAFRDQPSVLRNEIQAVLCAPIGQPARGVIYLQSHDSSDTFAARNREALEMFARQVAMVADRFTLRSEDVDATRDIRRRFRCDGIVGHSPALAKTLREAAQIAPPVISVLIVGATGTGKSVLARAIAANSARAGGPYIDLNCAAIPEALLEGELFGAEPGAYTGATRRMPGKVAAARGGTLFLDEVAELSSGAQAKLLQLLQERRYYPLGSTTPVTADVRVISATNADLKARVAQRQFREDLYYRLAVITIAMPSLEDRREDIPELVERFCAETCQRNEQLPALRPTRRALFACREAAWPGNVRELANAIEAGVARATFEGAIALDEHHVFPAVPRDDRAPSYREATQRFQRRLVAETLARHDWNITRAALDLDLNRQHLHELIASLGLRRPERVVQADKDTP